MPGAVRAQFALGAVLEEQDYLQVPAAPPLARGTYGDVPDRFSMRDFVPRPGHQGDQQSCVGWATAYAARTLVAARSARVSGPSRVTPLSFSPAFVFNQIKVAGCDQGSRISDGLSLMQKVGALELSQFPFDEQSCDRLPTEAELASAEAFRIKGFQRLWGPTSRNKHVSARRALAAGHPVVIGMMIPRSMPDLRGEVFRPTEAERMGMQALYEKRRTTEILGGHAMTVIGYDDSRDGGRFEIVNSWGDAWGDGGFFWLSYKDFNHFVTQGYEMIPPDPPRAATQDMRGSLVVKHISGGELAAQIDGPGYRLLRPLPSGARFRVEARTDRAAHLYVIGGDATGDFVELFPRHGRVAPFVSGGERLLLPGPTESHFTRLNETTGTDHYILLAARKPLDVSGTADRMAAAGGDVWARLSAALGDRLIAPDGMTLSPDEIGFAASSTRGDVAALVLNIDHVAPGRGTADRSPPLIVLRDPAPDAFDAAQDPQAPLRVPQPVFRLDGVAQDESPIAALTVSGAEASRFSSRGAFRAELSLPPGPGPHSILVEATDAAGNIARRELTFLVGP